MVAVPLALALLLLMVSSQSLDPQSNSRTSPLSQYTRMACLSQVNERRTSWTRRQRLRDAQHSSTLAKVNFRNDVREALDEATSESSGLEGHEVLAVAATIPEVYQAEGPVDLYEVSGETLFNAVVDKAVEKFEIKETEKLVKEYEVITRDHELSIGYLADEDEFELVDHVKL